MRARTLVLAVGIAALAAARPVAAARMPEIVAGVGATTAIEGEPDGGGASLGLALLWPLETHFRAGVMGFTDDLGVREDRLIGPGGEDLGPIPGSHRSALGLVWRMEAHLPTTGRYDVFLGTTWGGYRVVDDLRGQTTRTLNAVGFGLGLGLARRLAAAHEAGITLRYQQLSRGTAQRYLSAAAEWRWQRGATD